MIADDAFVVGVLVVAVLLVARAIARRTGLPDAIPLVVLGLGASFLPGLPHVAVEPRVVFLLFLPPLLYHAAFFTSPRETRANAPAILGLAVGLVLATAVVVAVGAHTAVSGMGWAPAFALGAILAPTDPVAASAVLQRLGAPQVLVTILEGESLVNDGIALTIFGLAVDSAGGTFDAGHGAGQLATIVLGGIGWGLVVGVVTLQARKLLADAETAILLSLATPFLAYIPAEHVGSSGVLATVTAGLFLGVRGKGVVPAPSRLQTYAFWDVLTYVLESTLFVLLGLEVRSVVGQVPGISGLGLVGCSVLVLVLVIGVRVFWELVVPPLATSLRSADIQPLPLPWRMVIGGSGLRGAISLALALSVPAMQDDGARFPFRNLILVVTIVVVLGTLIGGALTLPVIMRGLGVAASEEEKRESAEARRRVAEVALSHLEEAAGESRVSQEAADALRQIFQLRVDRWTALLDLDRGEPHAVASEEEAPDAGSAALRVEMARAQRAALQSMYDDGEIGNGAFREVSHDLDLDESRFSRA